LLASLPFEELGRVDNGVWIACPDDTVRALANRFAPKFLYFDRAAYEAAVRDLPGAKVEEAIRYRRDRWTPEAFQYVQQWLMDLEAARLEFLFGSMRWQSGGLSNPEVFRSLTLLRKLAGLESYVMVTPKAMGVTIAQGESRLLDVLESALASGLFEGSEEGALLGMHAGRRKLWARGIGRALAGLGAPEFPDGLVSAGVGRGVLLKPVSDSLAQSLPQKGEPTVRVRDGMVLVMLERHFPDFVAKALTLQIVYEEPADFYDSIETLTEAQRQRDIAARLARSPEELRRARRAQIDWLHLYQMLLKLEFTSRPDARDACMAAALPSLLAEEIAMLERSLYTSASFSVRVGMDAAQAGAAAEADNALFAALAQRFAPSAGKQLGEIQLLRRGGPPPA
jgi:hypothetical protein